MVWVLILFVEIIELITCVLCYIIISVNDFTSRYLIFQRQSKKIYMHPDQKIIVTENYL